MIAKSIRAPKIGIFFTKGVTNSPTAAIAVFLVIATAAFLPTVSITSPVTALPAPVVTVGLDLSGFLMSGLPAVPPPVVVTLGRSLSGFLMSGLLTPLPPVVVTLGLNPCPGLVVGRVDPPFLPLPNPRSPPKADCAIA